MATYILEQRTGDTQPEMYLEEFNLYGSDRLGVARVNKKVVDLPEPSGELMPCTLGLKMYELKNHASAIYGGRVAKNSKKTAIIEIEELEIVAIDDVLVKISETDTSEK